MHEVDKKKQNGITGRGGAEREGRGTLEKSMDVLGKGNDLKKKRSMNSLWNIPHLERKGRGSELGR